MAAAVPWLMLAEKEDEGERREFFDLSKGLTHCLSYPELVGKRCLGVGFPGWLFSADELGNMQLFHLFTREVISLPGMSKLHGFDHDEQLGYCRYYVEKAVLSSDPSNSQDYVLALIQGYPRTFAFWRQGQESFTSVQGVPERAYSDITWHDGQFYGVDYEGNIYIFDFRGGSQDVIAAPRVVKGIPGNLIIGAQVYIFSDEQQQLFVTTRDGVYREDEDSDYGAKNFHVYKIKFDVDDMQSTSYEEVKDLGNTALFVGASATLAVQEQEAPHINIQGSHIYYTDDCSETYLNMNQGGGKDMGIYNLLDGTIRPHYTGQSLHKVSPPLWVFTNSPSNRL